MFSQKRFLEHLSIIFYQEMSTSQAFREIFQNVVTEYKKNSTKKLLMVDIFIVYTLLTAILQVRILFC